MKDEQLFEYLESQVELPAPSDTQFRRIADRIRAEEQPREAPRFWKIWGIASTAVCALLLTALLTVSLLPSPTPENTRYSSGETTPTIIAVDSVGRFYAGNTVLPDMKIRTSELYLGPKNEIAYLNLEYVYTDSPLNVMISDSLSIVIILDRNLDNSFLAHFDSCKTQMTLSDGTVISYYEPANSTMIVESLIKFERDGYRYFVEYNYLPEEANLNGRAIRAQMTAWLGL